MEGKEGAGESVGKGKKRWGPDWGEERVIERQGFGWGRGMNRSKLWIGGEE